MQFKEPGDEEKRGGEKLSGLEGLGEQQVTNALCIYIPFHYSLPPPLCEIIQFYR